MKSIATREIISTEKNRDNSVVIKSEELRETLSGSVQIEISYNECWGWMLWESLCPSITIDRSAAVWGGVGCKRQVHYTYALWAFSMLDNIRCPGVYSWYARLDTMIHA